MKTPAEADAGGTVPSITAATCEPIPGLNGASNAFGWRFPSRSSGGMAAKSRRAAAFAASAKARNTSAVSAGTASGTAIRGGAGT